MDLGGNTIIGTNVYTGTRALVLKFNTAVIRSLLRFESKKVAFFTRVKIEPSLDFTKWEIKNQLPRLRVGSFLPRI